MIVASRSAFSLPVSPFERLAKGTRRSKNRGQWSLEIVRDGSEQRGAQALRLHGAPHSIHVLNEVDAFDCQRALVDQCIEEVAAHRA